MKLSDLKSGDVILCVNPGCDCLEKGRKYTVYARTKDELIISCSIGNHQLYDEELEEFEKVKGDSP